MFSSASRLAIHGGTFNATSIHQTNRTSNGVVLMNISFLPFSTEYMTRDGPAYGMGRNRRIP